MTATVDLATLGIKIDATQVTPAASKLDTLAAAGGRAETATEQLTQATTTLNGKTLALGASLGSAGSSATKYARDLGVAEGASLRFGRSLQHANDNSKATGFALRNLSFQLNDVATGLATGQSPFMILAQQGGQFVQIMQQGGIGLFGLLRAIPAAIGPIGLAVGAVGAAIATAFAYATHQINATSGDLTRGLGLTADQLEDVKRRTVSFGDTFKATFQVLGERIFTAFEPAFKWIGKAFVMIMEGARTAMEVFIGVHVAAFRVVQEAYKAMPVALGGEGKTAGFEFQKAFASGLTDTKNALDRFYKDVADKARKNRIAEILKEAGKGKSSKEEGFISSAQGQLKQIQDQVREQHAYNEAISSGAKSVAEANRQESISNGTKALTIRYNADIAKGTAASLTEAARLKPILEDLRVVYGEAFDERNLRELAVANDNMRKQNLILEEQIALAGKSNDARDVAIAQFKELLRLGKDVNTSAGQTAIGLSGDRVRREYGLSRSFLLSDIIDEGTGLGTDAARATLASDPEAYVKKQRAAYEEIDKLRQQDVISETEAARAKARVDAEINAQRLSATASFFDNLATLSNSSNKELAAIGKAAAIARATIDGILAVQKALAEFPPPVNYIMAAGVGIAAAANVAKIAGIKFAGGGTVHGPGGPTDDKVSAWLSPGEEVINARAAGQNRPLLKAINAGANPSNVGSIRVVIEDHGTAKTYTQVAGLTAQEVRLIATDVVETKTPGVVAGQLADPNSKVSRGLQRNTNVRPKRTGTQN